MKKQCVLYCLPIFYLFFPAVTSAQWQTRPLNYGVRAMLNYSGISGLETTILSEPYFINYSMTKKSRFGGGGAAFVSYRSDFIGIEGELGYSHQGSELDFNNYEKDFNYKMEFLYQYINILGRLKLYPVNLIDPARNQEQSLMNGWFVTVGPQLGLNISDNNIKYTSGGTGRLAAFGTDLEQQQQLRNVLKGKSNFGISLGMGIEFSDSGLALDFRWLFGLSDVVETQANSYNFIEIKNINKVFQFTLAWDFSVFNQKSY